MNPLLPETIQKTIFTSADRQIVVFIRNHTIHTCRYKIAESYIKQAFNKFRKGFVYKQNDTIVGVCIWKEKVIHYDIQKNGTISPDEKRLEILLLCSIQNSVRLGSRILEDIDSYCIDNYIEYVDLEPSDDNTMIFYEKNGYRITSPPYQKKRVMTKYIESFKIQKHPRGTTRRKRASSRGDAPQKTSRFLSRREFFSLSPEEARQMMNYNIDLTNVEAQSP